MSVLEEVRTKLMTNELSIIDDQPALLEIWQKMQQLREEMNEAKKIAAAKAAEPYLETMVALEKNYAFLLKLIA